MVPIRSPPELYNHGFENLGHWALCILESHPTCLAIGMPVVSDGLRAVGDVHIVVSSRGACRSWNAMLLTACSRLIAMIHLNKLGCH